MMRERQPVAARRDAQIGHPVIRLVNHTPDWKLNPLAVLQVPNYCQLGTIGCPIRPRDVIHHLPWRASSKWHTSHVAADT